MVFSGPEAFICHDFVPILIMILEQNKAISHVGEKAFLKVCKYFIDGNIYEIKMCMWDIIVFDVSNGDIFGMVGLNGNYHI